MTNLVTGEVEWRVEVESRVGNEWMLSELSWNSARVELRVG